MAIDRYDHDEYGLTLDGHNERINRDDEELGRWYLQEHIDEASSGVEDARSAIARVTKVPRWWESHKLKLELILINASRMEAQRQLDFWTWTLEKVERWDEEERSKAAAAAAAGTSFAPRLHREIIQMAQRYREDSLRAYIEAQDQRDIAAGFEPTDDSEAGDDTRE